MNINGIKLKHLSYSSISLWQECPRKWVLRYKYNIQSPITDAYPFGTAIHRIVQRSLVDGGVTKEAADSFGIDLKRAMIEAQFKCSPELFSQLERLGTSILENETTQYILNNIRITNPANVEKRVVFSVPDVPVPVIGYIDLIDDDGQLYDLKTSRWGWSDEDAANELQPDFYLTAMDDIGDTRHSGTFNHVILIKDVNAPISYILTTDRGPAYREKVYTAVQSMWEGLVSRNWESMIGVFCEQCKLRAHCTSMW